MSHRLLLIGPTGLRATIEVNVDTSLLFGSIPETTLRWLNVTSGRSLRIGPPADGEPRPIGQVEAELDDYGRTHLICLFSPDDMPARIGRHALDCYGLELDPATGRLRSRIFPIHQHF